MQNDMKTAYSYIRFSTVSIHKWELQPLSVEQMGLILGALGIKAWQRGRESIATGQPNS